MACTNCEGQLVLYRGTKESVRVCEPCKMFYPLSPSVPTVPIPRNYRMIPSKSINSGAFGYVCMVFTGKEYRAVKRPNPAVDEDEKKLVDRNFETELNTFASLKPHPNIVKFYWGAIRDDLNHELWFEYLPMNLKQYIDACAGRIPNLSEIFEQIKSGLQHLHDNDYMHRDLKPGNILVDSLGKVAKLCDFGSCCRYEPLRRYSVIVCTLWYRAPELLLGHHYYNKTMDIWSLGCVAYELKHGVAPFRSEDGTTREEHLRLIISKIGTPPDIRPEYKHLLPILPRHPDWIPCPMLSCNPEARPQTPLECML